MSGDQMAYRQQGQAPFPVDSQRLVFDLSQTFNPLADGFGLDLQVSPARDGYVCVSVALPEGMTRAFVALLDSLHGLVRIVDGKSRAAFAGSRALDLSLIEERRQQRDSYTSRVCSLFDQLREQGQSMNEAVKAVNRQMKSERHPWATFDLVKEELRRNGRLRSTTKSGSTRQRPA